MAVYGAGVGLTMPQAMASALMPFPDRAGAASSLLGICQMSFAALLGIALGQHLDGSALPLPIAVAATGVTALAVFFRPVGRETQRPEPRLVLRQSPNSLRGHSSGRGTRRGQYGTFSSASSGRHEWRIPARGASDGIR